jgi:hypothetical protein
MRQALLGRFAVNGLLTASLLVLCSCDAGTPKTVPVTGKVTFKNVPVEGVTVIFSRGQSSMTTGEVAVGKTDANGEYTLTSHFGPQVSAAGAVVGDYKVTIAKSVPPPNIDPVKYKAMVDAANKVAEVGGTVPANQQPPPMVELFAKEYSNIANTKLSASVKSGGTNRFDFNVE